MSVFEIFKPKPKKNEENFKTPNTDLRSMDGGKIKPLMEIRSDLRKQEGNAYKATPVDYQFSFLRPHVPAIHGVLGVTGPYGGKNEDVGLTGPGPYQICATTMPSIRNETFAYVEEDKLDLVEYKKRLADEESRKQRLEKDRIRQINETKERYGMEPIKPKEGLFDKIYGSLKPGPGESLSVGLCRPSKPRILGIDDVVVKRNMYSGMHYLARREYPENVIPPHLKVYANKFANTAKECSKSVHGLRGKEHVEAMRKCMGSKLVD